MWQQRIFLYFRHRRISVPPKREWLEPLYTGLFPDLSALQVELQWCLFHLLLHTTLILSEVLPIGESYPLDGFFTWCRQLSYTFSLKFLVSFLFSEKSGIEGGFILIPHSLMIRVVLTCPGCSLYFEVNIQQPLESSPDFPIMLT